MVLFNNYSFTSMDYIILIFSLIVIGVVLSSSFYFFRIARNKEGSVQRYALAIALFFLFYGIHRIIFLIFEATFNFGPIWNYGSKEIAQIYQNNPKLALQSDIIIRISTLSSMIGLVILTFELERYILERKTKYIITIMELCMQVPYFIAGGAQSLDISIIHIMFYISTALFLAIPVIYFYMASKTSGITRKRAITAGMGMCIAYSGITLVSFLGKNILESLWGLNGIHLGYILYGIVTSLGLMIYVSSVKY